MYSFRFVLVSLICEITLRTDQCKQFNLCFINYCQVNFNTIFLSWQNEYILSFKTQNTFFLPKDVRALMSNGLRRWNIFGEFLNLFLNPLSRQSDRKTHLFHIFIYVLDSFNKILLFRVLQFLRRHVDEQEYTQQQRIIRSKMKLQESCPFILN